MDVDVFDVSVCFTAVTATVSSAVFISGSFNPSERREGEGGRERERERERGRGGEVEGEIERTCIMTCSCSLAERNRS